MMIANTLSQPYTAQVRQRGQFTIPQKIRESLNIEEGDSLNVLMVGDAILLTPKAIRTQELAEKIADMLDAEGISLADLLQDLPQIRSEIYRERYSNPKV